MTESDLITLVEIEDKFIAEDIQQLLEDYQIYSVLISDNPASTVLNVYSGFAPIENISIRINKIDYLKDTEIMTKSEYKDLLTNS